jgi:hypothetical protein
VLTTSQKGAAAELAIAHAAAALGVGVLKPLTDGERYDLVFDVRSAVIRVQCKSAALHGSVLKVPCHSARRSRSGFVKRYYETSEIDALAAYSAELERCFFIPLAEIPGRTCLQLRLAPCRNGQQIGVNWADAFNFGARLRALVGP